jgi:hypothetical protein
VSRARVTAVLTAAALGSACRADRPAPAVPPVAAAAVEWREVGAWSGDRGRQTESFEVSPFAMRLRWQTTKETAPGAGRFTVTLHSAVSGRPLQTIVETHGVGSATVNVNDEPRWCHFVVDAEHVEWRMTLEQGFASEPHR